MEPMELQELNDDELVELAKGRDHSAFEQLLQRHSPASVRLAVSILKNQSDADDEVQNSFLNAWRYFGQFHRDATFSTWMSRIVVNQCLMRLRSARRASFVYLDELSEETGSPRVELADPGTTQETNLGRQQTTAILHREIRRLPPLLRNVVVLRDLHELPLAEVSLRLGISVMATKSRLLRARHELRQRIERHFQGSGGMPATA
jgi:RNA polymerase sigma-70 factor (ECF subfamily)